MDISKQIKVKDLVNELLEYNQEANITVIAHNKKYDFTISFGGPEGVTKENTNEVSFYVDELCKNELINNIQ